VLSRALRGIALQISPPLVVAEGELEAMVRGLGAAIEEAVSDLHD
jgi:adenosylmethionine-8-amino-7-oxononanoate aminotransferase